MASQGDSIHSSTSSIDSSSSSSSASIGPNVNDMIQAPALPPTALTNDSQVRNPLPSTKYSNSLDSSVSAKAPKVNDKFIRSLNTNYNSVYVSLRDNDAMSKTSQKDAEDLRSNFKSQITI